MMSLTLEQFLDFLAPDESLGQLFGRLGREQLSSGLQAVDRHLKLRPGVVLEACGPASSGKSELLLQVAVHVLLDGTSQQHGESADVFKKSVVLMDLDGKFDGLRFIQVLQAHVRARNAQLAELVDSGVAPPPLAAQARTMIQAAEDDCLARMHIIRPHSSAQLLAALLALPRLLARCKEQHAPCALLLLDNVGAFYHQDRNVRPLPAAKDGLDGSSGTPGAKPPARPTVPAATVPQPPLLLQRVHSCLTAALHRLAAEWRLSMVTTKYVSSVSEQVAADGTSIQLIYKEYLPACWSSLLTHHIVLGHPQARVWEQDGSSSTEVVSQVRQDGQLGPAEKVVISQARMDIE